ncbi:guanine nucleotide-binding protein-like 3 homolog [Melanaphis sacchari]|uniref:guanine nucleotide-binding protein-like 3 homolog n=1 Tax=Melanaphis sacchari TaxID=742174 RepID=UPI000DC14C36|nr:guanine nucleotide-binding protein-like 3 homolog [Melanaphis sacchari]
MNCLGVVSMPNVGKSSLINNLKRSRTCSIGAVPGVTNFRNMQEIQLNKHIKLLNCPDIVLDKTSTTSSVRLKNVASSGNIEESITCAATIVRHMHKLYRI